MRYTSTPSEQYTCMGEEHVSPKKRRKHKHNKFKLKENIGTQEIDDTVEEIQEIPGSDTNTNIQQHSEGENTSPKKSGYKKINRDKFKINTDVDIKQNPLYEDIPEIFNNKSHTTQLHTSMKKGQPHSIKKRKILNENNILKDKTGSEISLYRGMQETFSNNKNVYKAETDIETEKDNDRLKNYVSTGIEEPSAVNSDQEIFSDETNIISNVKQNGSGTNQSEDNTSTDFVALSERLHSDIGEILSENQFEDNTSMNTEEQTLAERIQGVIDKIHSDSESKSNSSSPKKELLLSDSKGKSSDESNITSENKIAKKSKSKISPVTKTTVSVLKNNNSFNSENNSSESVLMPAKKAKKHDQNKAKTNLTMKSDGETLHSTQDRKNNATPRKKHKTKVEESSKKNHSTPSNFRFLSDSDDPEIQITNEPHWESESKLHNNISENENPLMLYKSIANKSKWTSKVSPDCSSRKDKSVIVSSTPYSLKEKKNRNSKMGESSTLSFNNSTQSESAADLSQTSQLILEDSQCEMIASEEDLKKLKKLEIKIDWELSPLHKIDSGSCKMNMTTLREKLGHSEFLDSGKFTKEDENKIKHSWEEFSKEYHFDNPELFFPSRQNVGVFPYIERHNFKLYLAKHLPRKRLFSVYSKFVDIYGVKRRGRYSDEEDRLLLDLYFAYKEEHSKDGESDDESNIVKLGIPLKKIMQRALNRTNTSIDARLKILLENEQAKNLSKNIDWTSEQEGALVYNLIKKSKVSSLEDLRHLKITYRVWRKVVTKMELPLEKVLSHWKYHLYPQLFAHQPVLRNMLQIELIKWLYKSNIKDIKQVDWNDLSRRSGDLGSCYLYRVFSTLIGNFVPKELRGNLRETVAYLFDYYLPRLKEKKKSGMMICKYYDPETRRLHLRTEDEEDCLPFMIE